MPGWLVEGEVFVDGSSFSTQHGGLRRAGWAVTSCNDDGSFRCGMYGAVPLPWSLTQSSREAEDDAFPASDGSLTVVSDCAGAIGRARNASKALSLMNPNRHVWESWWRKHGESAS
eukprot:9466867-Pyramimonas_sp.AAC.1